MLQAIEAIYNENSLNIRTAARIYDVPRLTLANRLDGLPTRQKTQLNNRSFFLQKKKHLFDKFYL